MYENRPRSRWGKILSLIAAALVLAVASAVGIHFLLGSGMLPNGCESDPVALMEALARESSLMSELELSKEKESSLFSEFERLKDEVQALESELDELKADAQDDPNSVDPFELVAELLQHPPVSYASVAMYYEDIESGRSYSFNSEEMFYGASLVKLPFALELLHDLENMDDDGLDDVFIYTEESWCYGSGYIVNSPPGTRYTYHELLKRMLRDSDNVAFNELAKKYGRSLVADFTEREGLVKLSDEDWSLNASDCAKILRCAYDYIEGDYKYSDMIKETMLSSGHRVMICSLDKPVAHKYGWDEYAYHDLGIVYGSDSDGKDRPYFLAILTDLDSGSDDPEVDLYIRTLVRVVDKIHTLSYGKRGA